ncbi:glutamate 5-kinase [Evansella cellulosilytica]|uniref:Glutamate 5-kinase n=1 Tax=Evansella cellulosilytica (strain ATCC 21833 / DSM 2522 / FERM P-1141 / JCM 9156 / N-4) TaxID=649639 RepID=E6U0V6_EVAC2|nr:glutamate 5-kinase [Evansella cellulosilytica]ADU30268.1 glutamate 5-kinase [Evansella cellulosilytica DSM 2522]
MSKKRIVVKIGSSSLTKNNGELHIGKLTEHTEAIVELKKKGHDIILISSGAVAAGFKKLGYPTRPVKIAGKQAAAAVGQGLLIQGYTEAFQKHSIAVAQLLLTRNDFVNQEQYKNAYATLTELLKRDVVPIINENDSTSIEELTFGDNDMLSALVSGLIHADHLIILTDINGLYDEDPRKNKDAKKYHFLPEITGNLLIEAKENGSKLGTGGMKSKINAAKTAFSLGVNNIFIGSGYGATKLHDILLGKGDGTYIGKSERKVLNNKKQWIAFHSSSSGKIVIDTGAVQALLNKGRSLLPVGITEVYGSFQEGAVVEIINEKGKIIGKGQVNYSSDELLEIKGKDSCDAKKFTNKATVEAIHRDHLLIL